MKYKDEKSYHKDELTIKLVIFYQILTISCFLCLTLKVCIVLERQSLKNS